MWRARLIASPDTPRKSCFLTGGKLLATYYPIDSQGQFVWTVCASEGHLKAAGIKVNHGPSRCAQSKENQLPNYLEADQQDKAIRGNSIGLSVGEVSLHRFMHTSAS